MRTCFIILHYLAEDVTRRCLDSVLSLDGGEDISAVVVDNCSPDGSGKRLEDRYGSDCRLHFIHMDCNEGFSRGNNAGYRYALEHLCPDFVVVMNNDVIIEDRHFARSLESAYATKPFAVLGPDIISARTGRHQNPFRESPLTQRQVRRLRMTMALKRDLLPLFFIAGRTGDKPKAADSAEVTPTARENCVLHGSCLVFSRDFTSRRPLAFNPSTFLYCEEDILERECRKDGLAMRFDPALRVRHLEHCASDLSLRTRYGRSKARYTRLVESLDILAGI